MHLLGFPPERDLGNMIRSNLIVNCPLTFDDVKNAKLIFGPDITSFKGKSVRCNPASVVTDYVDIPREIIELRKELEVSTEIIFINKLPFLVSISRGLKFTTIEYLSSKSDIALVNSINKIVSYNNSHGLHEHTMFVDPDFQFLEEKVVSTALNTRGYIPKIFAFENRYALNPEESDLFYFLLICTKRPKSPKFQREVSSSYNLHAIQRIPRENKPSPFS